MTLSLKKPRPAPIPITWNNVAIEENTEFSILGVTIVNDMTWGSHILKLISKASKRLYVLRKYRDILPRKALETIYISMIRPILEYGDVLYNSMPLSTGRLLENIQRQAAIICSGAYRHTSYEKLLLELGWEALSTRRQNHKLIIFYKIFHHIYPNYLYNCLHLRPTNPYNLRQQNPIIPRYSRLTISSNSFFPSTTRKWNILPQSTQHAISTTVFKSLIRGKFTKNPYNTLCTGKYGRWLARLRMNLSALNSHRYNYNFISSPTCPYCQTGSETSLHYFFICPAHRLARTTLIIQLQNELGLDTQNLHKLLETILFGKHINP